MVLIMSKDLFNYTMNTLFSIGFALLLIGLGVLSIEWYNLKTEYIENMIAIKYLSVSFIGLVLMLVGSIKRTR